MMKKIISLLGFFTFFCSQVVYSQNSVNVSELTEKEGVYYFNNKPYTGEIFEMHPPLIEGGEPSQKSMSAHLLDGKEDGKLIRYYENGKIALVQYFKKGIIEKTETYHINGNYAAKYIFKNGKHEGIQKEYHENGNLASKGAAKNGNAEGVWEWFHENEQLKHRGAFKNGEKHGDFVWKDENGKVSNEETWNSGLMVYETSMDIRRQEIVESILDQDFSINSLVRARGNVGTLLDHAIYWDRLKTVQLLIERGAEAYPSSYERTFNFVTSNSDGALPFAISSGHTEIIRYLFGRGISIPKEIMRRLLLKNVESENTEITELLLDYGADPNAEGYSGSILHWAAYMNLDSVMPALIHGGADVEMRDEEGMTPLHVAAKQKSRGALLVLIESGADIHATSGNGWQPIHFAAASGAISVVRPLLEAGVEVNALTKDGQTPLGVLPNASGFYARDALREAGGN